MSHAQQCLYRMLSVVSDDVVGRTQAAMKRRQWKTMGDLTTRSVFTFYLDETYRLD